MNVISILVEKSKRKLTLFSEKGKWREFDIDLGRNPLGPKQFDGDTKTPEGTYFIDGKNPNSSYFLNLGISYPSEENIAFAKSHDKQPGGLIKIHGEPNAPETHPYFPDKDWTMGCIALNNSDMKELFELIEIGTAIEIRP